MSRKVQRAQEYLLNDRGVDYIMDYTETPDFVECVCKIGGDTVTYRVRESDCGINLTQR